MSPRKKLDDLFTAPAAAQVPVKLCGPNFAEGQTNLREVLEQAAAITEVAPFTKADFDSVLGRTTDADDPHPAPPEFTSPWEDPTPTFTYLAGAAGSGKTFPQMNWIVLLQPPRRATCSSPVEPPASFTQQRAFH